MIDVGSLSILHVDKLPPRRNIVKPVQPPEKRIRVQLNWARHILRIISANRLKYTLVAPPHPPEKSDSSVPSVQEICDTTNVVSKPLTRQVECMSRIRSADACPNELGSRNSACSISITRNSINFDLAPNALDSVRPQAAFAGNGP